MVTRPAVSMPAAVATAATVVGPSPEMTLTSTPSRSRKATVEAASPRIRSERTVRAIGVSVGSCGASSAAGSAIGPLARARRRTRFRSAARCSMASRALWSRPAASARTSGAPRTMRSPSSSSRPLHFQRDENGTSTVTPRGSPGMDSAIASAVGLRPPRFGGEAAEHGPGLVLGAGERDDLVEAEGAVGERAGLVDADHVDPGQGLDRVEPLDEGAAPGHAAGGDGEGDAGEQHEALGDERDDARGGLGDRLADRGVVHVQGDDERAADRDHHQHQDPQQAVDVLLQRRERLAVALGLADELVGVGLGADLVGEVDPRAGDAERAGLDGVAGAPGDRVGLAGEHRLVELQPAGLGERAVGDDLLARAEPDRVAGDDVLDEQRALLAVPQHAGARGHEQGEPVELLLGPDLLQDPDPGVDQQDDREDQVRDLSGDDQGERERAQDQVEQRERVLADDRPVAAAGRRAHGGTAHGEPPFGLGLGQPWCRDRCHDDNPSVELLRRPFRSPTVGRTGAP